jgi:molybdopterin molybdotransferase
MVPVILSALSVPGRTPTDAMSALTPLAEALQLILAEDFSLPEIETCALPEALGRVLGEDIRATVPVPYDDNSAMDGYALRASESDDELLVSQRIPAGTCGTEVLPGTAARIFTGAPIPPGADAVVMQENCQLEGDRVRLLKGVEAGQNIRPRGQDIAAGDTVLVAGRRLGAQDLGVLASVGVAAVPVRRKLVVAIFSTGDELVEPAVGAGLNPGQIFNSNRYTMQGLLRGLGFEVRDLGVVADTPEATAAVLTEAANTADCILSSGGVSVGEEDHVKSQVEKLGELRLWKLRIKPGKPLAYGRIGNTPFFGLPGNPAAVFVTFAVVVRPWLLQRQGATNTETLILPARAGFELEHAGSRQEYLRVLANVSEGELWASLHSNQSSGVLSSVSWANALAVIPPNTTVARGDAIELILLDQLSR